MAPRDVARGGFDSSPPEFSEYIELNAQRALLYPNITEKRSG